MVGANLRRSRHQLPAHRERQPIIQGRQTGWMAVHPHWLPRLIATANKYEHAGSTFLEGHILRHLIGDRIYAEINPHRSEDGGTKIVQVLVFQSAAPADAVARRGAGAADPQRVPAGRGRGVGPDISQQEYRFIVHYAARARFTKGEGGGRALPHSTPIPTFTSSFPIGPDLIGSRQRCQLRQGVRCWCGKIRGDDRQVRKRGARDLRPATTANFHL